MMTSSVRRRVLLGLACSAVVPASQVKAEVGRPRLLIAANGPARLKVRVQGRGPGVLMLPSLGRGASDFDDLAARLTRAGFTAIRPEPRGIGGSTGPLETISLDDLADDAAAAIVAARGGSVVAVGHAFGNRVARRLATRHPRKVRAVALLAAGGKVRMAPDIEAALLRSFDLALPDRDRLSSVGKAFFAEGNDPAVWRDGSWPHAAEAQIAATGRTPVESWWAAGGKPILVMQGLEDVLAPPANAELLKAELGDQVMLVGAPRAGHAMLPEQPEMIASEVIAFARRHSRS